MESSNEEAYARRKVGNNNKRKMEQGTKLVNALCKPEHDYGKIYENRNDKSSPVRCFAFSERTEDLNRFYESGFVPSNPYPFYKDIWINAKLDRDEVVPGSSTFCYNLPRRMLVRGKRGKTWEDTEMMHKLSLESELSKELDGWQFRCDYLVNARTKEVLGIESIELVCFTMLTGLSSENDRVKRESNSKTSQNIAKTLELTAARMGDLSCEDQSEDLESCGVLRNDRTFRYLIRLLSSGIESVTKWHKSLGEEGEKIGAKGERV